MCIFLFCIYLIVYLLLKYTVKPFGYIHSIFTLIKSYGYCYKQLFRTFTGRIGNMVIYPLAGQIVARTIGKSYKNPQIIS
ncbi:hypothetical protein CS542_00805 [Pedobacter sp. IW39]|nr:hypothetical protein CS542_00805 [Pedobacter sp. IW39]